MFRWEQDCCGQYAPIDPSPRVNRRNLAWRRCAKSGSGGRSHPQSAIDLPESGYRVVYHQIPLSPEEIKSRREDVFELLDKGMISRVAAYTRLNPGITRTQASRALDGIEGRTDAVDEIRAAREELEDLVGRIDAEHASRLRLMAESLDHGLRLLDQQLAEDVAEAGAY